MFSRIGSLVRAFRGALAATLLTVVSGGCERQPAPAVPAVGNASPAKGDATYVVRGKVAELPRAGDGRSGFRVHHEAIDTFVDGSGKVVGMGAMVMEFALAKGVTTSNLAVGDTVELTFEVTWKGQPPLRYADHRVTAIRTLPAATKLHFREARPPSTQSEPPNPAEARPQPGAKPVPGG